MKDGDSTAPGRGRRAARDTILKAVQRGNEAAVRAYLKDGGSASAAFNHGTVARFSLLMSAAKFGRATLVDMLLEHGAALDAQASNGMTALMVAAQIGDDAIVKRLIRRGANIRLRNESGLTALDIAQTRAAANKHPGHDQCIRAIRPQGGWTPLISAANRGDVRLVDLLLERSAEVDKRDGEGGTALTKAASLGHAEVVLRLLRAGADMAIRDVDGRTALQHAKIKGHAECEQAIRTHLEEVMAGRREPAVSEADATATLRDAGSEGAQADAAGELSDTLSAKLDASNSTLLKWRSKRQPPDGQASIEQVYQALSCVYTRSAIHGEGAICVDCHRTEALVATGGADGVVCLYDTPQRKVLAEMEGHDGPVHRVRLHPRVNVAVSAGADASVRVWSTLEMRSGSPPPLLKVMPLHTAAVNDVCIHPGLEYTVSASADGSWKMADLARGECVVSVEDAVALSHGGFSCSDVHPDGMLFSVGVPSGNVKVWDLKSRTDVASFGLEQPTTCLSFSENSFYFATGGAEGVLKVWDLRKFGDNRLEAVHAMELGAPVRSAVFDYSGQFLATAAGTVTVVGGTSDWCPLYESTSWASLAEHEVAASGVSFGPGASLLAAVCPSGDLFIYGRGAGAGSAPTATAQERDGERSSIIEEHLAAARLAEAAGQLPTVKKNLCEMIAERWQQTMADGKVPEEVWRAAERGREATIAAWIDSGGKMDATFSPPDGVGGTTLLMLAAGNGHERVVAALLQRGADPELCDAKGKTAVQIARQAGRAVCAEQIEAHVAAERAAKELEAKSRGEAPWADLAAGGASLHTPRSD